MRLFAVFLVPIVVGCSRAPESVAKTSMAPLAARSATAGKRFVKLDPAQSGLSFRNELRRENIVAYVYMGAGVAVGDYDQDGLPDLYLVSQDGRNKLFRQTAPLRFEDVTGGAATTGTDLGGGEAWGTAASFADVDGDGDLDLFVCNLESPNLLFQNNGDGTFTEKAGAFGLATTAASTGAGFADYDNDGDLDLFLLTNRVCKPTLPDEILAEMTPPAGIKKSREELRAKDLTFTYEGHTFMAGQRDRLFRNDGYAKFVDVSDEVGLDDHGNGLSVTWWDFDDDGWLDLYVANDFQSPDILWRNDGGKRFVDVTESRLPHTAFFGMGCDFGDLDGDGRQDLLVADMSSTTHYMGKMLMGSMDQHRWFLMNSKPPQVMRNALYVNTGTDRFLEAAHLAGLASTDWTWSVRFADLDEDGRLDLFATNGIPVFADNPDIGNRVAALWQERRYEAALDVLRNMPRVDEKNIARKNLGDLRFADVGAEWGLDEASVAHGAVVVDLDGDGDLDIVTNNLNAEASVFENRTADTHRLLVELRARSGNRFAVGARIEVTAGGVTQVRQLSPTRGYMSAGEPVEHFGLGAATVVERVTVRWPGGGEQTLENVPADQRLLIAQDAAATAGDETSALASRDGMRVFGTELVWRHQEREFDDFAVQPLLPHRLSRLGPGMACADFDGDGEDDLWVGGAAGQAGTLHTHRSKRGLDLVGQPAPVPGDAECEDMGGVFVDFDSDGDLDLYVASGGVEAGEGGVALRDRLYINDGQGDFSPAPRDVLPDLRDNSSCVAAADFDGDGDLDLFVGGRSVPGRFPYAAKSRLLRNDGGRFVDVEVPALADVGMVSGACWTDVDDDGDPDLVLAAQWQPLRVLRNDAGALVDATAAFGLAGLHGQWNGVIAADLDGDGDMDLVATNLGLNTKYKASPEKPLELFARDFDGNGTMDVVEAKHQGEVLLPVRGLSCSSQAMPFVREKFPTYDAFAKANLGEIYGDALQDSLALVCHELRHMVFEQRDGRFVARPLPRLAQISAAYGIGVLDVDGDGNLDLVLAQNSFSPEPETGPFDGGLGLLLRGDGELGFTVVPAQDSGIRVPGDQKALVVGEIRDRSAPGFALAVNDAKPLLFESSAEPQLSVRLVGRPGNPTAVGTRLTLRRGDRVLASREVQAGAGYLSQSSSTQWFARARQDDVLEVRWPDGTRTQNAVGRGEAIVVQW
ncbi:MAG: FG-GAP-like repeat-containing protein [Planctomycetota bacterium]